MRTHLAAETFVDACDGFQEEPQACEKREGGVGTNQSWTVPPSRASQTREAGRGLQALMTGLNITYYRGGPGVKNNTKKREKNENYAFKPHSYTRSRANVINRKTNEGTSHLSHTHSRFFIRVWTTWWEKRGRRTSDVSSSSS